MYVLQEYTWLLNQSPKILFLRTPNTCTAKENCSRSKISSLTRHSKNTARKKEVTRYKSEIIFKFVSILSLKNIFT